MVTPAPKWADNLRALLAWNVPLDKDVASLMDDFDIIEERFDACQREAIEACVGVVEQAVKVWLGPAYSNEYPGNPDYYTDDDIHRLVEAIRALLPGAGAGQ